MDQSSNNFNQKRGMGRGYQRQKFEMDGGGRGGQYRNGGGDRGVGYANGGGDRGVGYANGGGDRGVGYANGGGDRGVGYANGGGDRGIVYGNGYGGGDRGVQNRNAGGDRAGQYRDDGGERGGQYRNGGGERGGQYGYGGGDRGNQNRNRGDKGGQYREGGRGRGNDSRMSYRNEELQTSNKVGVRERGERVEPMKLAGEENLEFSKGTAGKKISLQSNFIALSCATEGILQYHVDFNPVVESRHERIRLLHQHDERLGGTVIFDGMLAFVPKPLSEEVTELQSVMTCGDQVNMTIRFVKVPKPKDCLQVFNIIFRKVMSKLNMCQIGRNYFLPMQAKTINKFDLEVWPGYVTSIGSYEGGVMLQMDVSHRVLNTRTALNIMEDIQRKNEANCVEVIQSELIGKSVLTRYNNKVYRVDDVAWEMSPMSEFTLSSGEKITFVDYYRKTYNVKITDFDQPLLISVSKSTPKNTKEKKEQQLICLIPELVYMTGLTDQMRNDFQMMRELATYTKLSPAARRESFLALVHSISTTPAAQLELKKWGFKLDSDLYELEGRVLPMEKIKFRNSEVSAGPEADWSRAVGNNQVNSAVDLKDWLMITTARDRDRADCFIEQYRGLSQDMGIVVGRPVVIELTNDRSESYLKAIRSNLHSKTQLVVVLFPFQREDRYNAIKRLLCLDNPVPSQVINKRTISDPKKLRSVTQKIALQINCKLGGTLWNINIPTKATMICGIDVNHDAVKNNRGSVLAFVSSINPECTRWYSKVKVQEVGEELSYCMKMCFSDAILKFYKENHQLPSKVVIYRDGVGDGQLPVVRDYELAQLKECKVVIDGTEFRPKLAFIVVQKRINTRLLATEMNSPNLCNPPPGTVVDHSVTKNSWYDFFIVSQHVRQGTVTPTHYVVLHDELGWNADRIQALTYKMTHLYYNWPGTVRVPAPCQYAHKLAYFVGENIKKEPSPHLNDKLFYL